MEVELHKHASICKAYKVAIACIARHSSGPSCFNLMAFMHACLQLGGASNLLVRVRKTLLGFHRCIYRMVDYSRLLKAIFHDNNTIRPRLIIQLFPVLCPHAILMPASKVIMTLATPHFYKIESYGLQRSSDSQSSDRVNFGSLERLHVCGNEAKKATIQ